MHGSTSEDDQRKVRGKLEANQRINRKSHQKIDRNGFM